MGIKFLLLIIIFLLFFSISLVLTIGIYKAAFLPYMDEIFHIPQAQAYCRGNYSYWDANITTPPGLYLISVGLFNPLIGIVPDYCSVLQLRTVNLVFALGNLYLIFAIFTQLNGNSKGFSWWICGLNSFTVATFPTLYFFTFLYYTDAGATFFVLFAYLLTLKKCYPLSALMGALSIFFRQTNVIWVGFCALLAVNDILHKYENREVKKCDRQSWNYLQVAFVSILELILGRRRRGHSVLEPLIDVVTRLSSYVIVMIGFIYFVIWNGGIVLGDRTAHRAVIHVPQLFYFLAFTLFFVSAHVINKENVKRFLGRVKTNRIAFILWATIILIVLATNTQFHRYNLSDNRHFTFYFYSKLIRRHFLCKYFLIPVYMFSGYILLDVLRKSQGILWTVQYLMCLTANLVFQSLLEFRYFIIGYLLFRLHLPMIRSKVSVVWVELLLYTLINVYTIHLFVMRPFVNPNDEVLSRFMW